MRVRATCAYMHITCGVVNRLVLLLRPRACNTVEKHSERKAAVCLCVCLNRCGREEGEGTERSDTSLARVDLCVRLRVCVCACVCEREKGY